MWELQQPENDGLLSPDVRRWSADKHYFLQRYIEICTVGMKGQPWIKQTHYVDLFAGAGIENVEGEGLCWGSPLIAAQSPVPFSHLHFCEKNPKKYEALLRRVSNIAAISRAQVLGGDANLCVTDVVKAIPASNTLTVAFIDPYGLHCDFDTVKALCSDGRRVDFIIFFPDHSDMLRNFGIHLENPDSLLDRVMGGADWRTVRENRPKHRWADEMRLLYESQMQSLGYQVAEPIRIKRTDGRELYRLLFFSRHERGADFWKKVTRKDRGGQDSFGW